MSTPPAEPLSAEAVHGPALARSSHGMRIIAAGFLGHLLAVGPLLSVYGVFIDHLAAGFGVGVAVIGFGPMAYQSVNASVAPFIGRLLARVPIRGVMITGAVLLGTGLVVVSRAQTLTQAGLAYAGLAGLGAVLLGALPSSTLIANWFVERRGRALGMAAAGTTGSSIVFPPLAAWLIAQYGWRQALLMLGVGVAVIGVPVVAALVINRPEDVGEAPDGRVLGPASAAGERAAEPVIPTREILRDPNFWVIGSAFGLVFGAGAVVMVYMVPFARELGLSLQMGALLVSLRAAMGVLGKVVLGSFSDRWGQRPVIWCAMAVQLVVWTALVSWPSVSLLIASSVVLGFTGGPLYPLRNALVAGVFGRHAFAPVIGLLSLVQFPFGLLTPLAGHLHDLTQDYAISFSAFIPVYVIAPLLLILVRMPASSPAAGEPSAPPR